MTGLPAGRGLIAGSDGCRYGWLVVTLDTDGRTIQGRTFDSTAALFGELPRLEILAIDIPIGLSEGPPRVCDREARRLLGPRASSVFPAPVRRALAATTYREACALSNAVCGKRLSRQAYGILPRIRDVDAQVRGLPPTQTRVREVHPEVCFYFWAGGRPMPFSKKEPRGFRDRLTLVEGAYPGAFASLRARFRRTDVADDDILDALATLWTAERLRRGRAVTIPELPPTDRYGLRMEMVA